MIPSPARLRAVRLTLAATCVMVLGALGPLAGSAGAATGYGELTRFGEPPKGGREAEAGPGELSEARTLAIGVDAAEENSVFVLEERKQEEVFDEAPDEKVTRFFRLKKFKAETAKNGTVYAEAKEIEFEETSPHLNGIKEDEQKEKPGVNGLAVDAKSGEVFVLTTDLRAETDTIDRSEGSEEREGVLAASKLYAFRTADLEELPQTSLDPQNEEKGKALLNPQGIAADPGEEEVIVLAHNDESGAANDNFDSANDHVVLARVKPGTGITSEYVDKNNVFKKELDGEVRHPNSPVVLQGAGGKASEERVLVNWNGLVKVPTNFSSSEAPKPLALSEPLNGFFTERIERGLLGPALTPVEPEQTEARPPEGGRLTASPEGTVFGATEVDEESKEGYEAREGVLAMSGTEGEPIGWTGGGFSQGKGLKNNACVIEPAAFNLSAQVAAGSGGDVFVLAPVFLRQEEEERGEPEFIENPPESEEFELVESVTFVPLRGRVPGPAIIEFGPGGTGCTEASAEGVEDEVVGTKGVKQVKAGTEVKFTSALKQADATKVEWTFEVETAKKEKETEAVTQDAAELRGNESGPQPYREPTLRHKLSTEGSYVVTEKIYSDDLAAAGQTVYSGGKLSSPTITLKLSHELKVEPSPPLAAFTFSPGEPHVGETVTFESKSTDPNGSKALPLSYTWSFGDGTSSGPSTSPTVTHVYSEAKAYTGVLTVEDALHQKEKVSHTFTVQPKKETTKEPPKEAPKEEPKEAPTETPKEAPKNEKPQGGVLSYELSVAPSAVTVSASGSLSVKVDCSGQSSCKGTVTLRTLKAVAAGKSKRKAILTLATGSFSIVGGRVQSVTLHLSSKARALLQHSHTLAARLTILGHDVAGNSHTTAATLTLKLAKPKKKGH